MIRISVSLVALVALLSACTSASEMGTCKPGVEDIATEANSVLCM